MNPAPWPSPHRLRLLLNGASGRRVLVVGDCMVDRYVSGAADRISPEAPVPVVRVGSERDSPGGAANVAAGVAALGGGARVAGAVGEDGDGEELRRLVEAAGVPSGGLVASPDRSTTVKTRVLSRGQQVVRLDRECDAPLPAPVRERLLAWIEEEMEDADAVAVADYDKGVLAEGLGPEVVRRAAARGLPAVVDPKVRRFGAYRGASVLTPNGRELAAAAGRRAPPRDGAELSRMRRDLGVESLLVTVGGRGMLLVDGNGRVERLPARQVEVFDVSGAGDTVTAVVALLLAAGAGVEEAARTANLAAGVAVSHRGVVAVGRDELLDAAG